MGYRMMGRGHAALVLLRERMGSEMGQGTVEYVALILLVAAVMAVVVTASTNDGQGESIAKKVTDSITNSVDKVVTKAK